MKRLLAFALVVASCSSTVTVTPTSPAPIVTSAATSTVTSAPTAAPLPSAAAGGIEVFATGALHGTFAWVVREEVASQDRVTESLYAVPLDGATSKLVIRRVRPRAGAVVGGYATTHIVVDRQLTRDGTRLVLEQANLGVAAHDGLVVVDIAAGTIGEIARGDQRNDVMPAWSPDGKRIAYARRVPGATPIALDDGLWLIDAGGGAARQVQPPATQAQVTYVFGWTADSAGVAFGLAFEGLGYSVLDLATGAVTGPNGVSFGLAPASWRIKTPQFAAAFSEGDKGGEQRIQIADGIGTPLRTLVRESGGIGTDPLFLNARWSPAGDEILYIRSSREGKIFRVPAAGGTPVAVPMTGQPFRAEWLPDGRIAYITVQNGLGAVLHYIDGTKETTLFKFDGGASFTDLGIRTYP